MIGPSSVFDHDRLLAEARWVRALAGSLLREPGAADDLAQETLLVSLRRPPPLDRPLRPWLAAVAKNLARQWRRSEASRVRRERARAERCELPSSADLVARTELHRLLVDEVLGLPEPQRTIVLLHYYEGSTLARIAAARGSAEATVRSQLARARQALRRRIEARGPLPPQALVGALALLAAPARPSLWPRALARLAAAGQGVLAMNALKIGTGVALAALAVVAGRELLTVGAEPAPATGIGPPAARSGAPDPSAMAVPDDERRAPAVETGASADPQASAPRAAAAEPDRDATPLAETWREVDAIALETFDGSVQLAQAYELALALLAHAQPAEGTWGEDGRREYLLVESEELGRASLHVRPGDPGSFDAFLIRMSTQSLLGYPGPSEGTRGSKLELRFGIGDGSIRAFGSWAEVQFEGDARAGVAGRGPLPRGAFLKVDEEEVNWRRQTIEAAFDESGQLSGAYVFGEPRAIVVGDLSAGRARELAALLAEFALP